MLMFFRRGTSVISEMYIVGAIITFYVGGFTVTFSPIFPMCPCEVTWTSPIGLIGGWLLILLSLVEYRSNRIQTSSVTASGSN
jgi:hypothetical protein